MNDDRRNFSITAFLVGGILGASSVLLFTPKSGREIRESIKLKADNYVDRAKAKADDLMSNSRSSAELLRRKAEDIMDTVQQYARGKIDKPVSVIEKEIAGFKAALAAVKASYALNPDIRELENERKSGQPSINEFEDETLPKHLGMGKGRSRRSYYS